MGNKELKNCWEFWGCPEEVKSACVAYVTASGRECWMVVGSNVTAFEKCPKAQEDYKNCWECPWFKNLNPGFDKRSTNITAGRIE